MRTLTISGNLGQDPEQRTTTNGTAVTNFDLAVRQNRPDQNGQYQTDWLRCTMFGKRAETIQQYFHKGDHVTVTGSLDIHQYQDRQGVTRTQVGVILNDFDLPQRKDQPANNAPSGNEEAAVHDADLPF